MSINHSNPDNMTEVNETTLYLLDMGPSLDLRTSEGTTQVYPLHIVENSTGLNYNKLFLPIEDKDGIPDQYEVSIGVCDGPAVEYINVPIENSCQRDQTQLLSTFQTQHELPSSLHVSCKELSNLVHENEPSETDLISPFINSYEQPLNCKKQIHNYVHIPDRSVIPRAVAVLPTVLQIRQKNTISARRTLLPRTRFGPIQGVKHKLSLEEAHELLQVAHTNKIPLFILRDNEELVHIDVSDKDKANWIGLLPLGDANSANVWIYEENGELYIITTEQVPSRKPLMLGYSRKYAQDYGLIGPTKEIDTGFPLNPKTWWCHECQCSMPSAYQLRRHMSAHQQARKPLRRRRPYRCRYCALTFTRIFTLRRHVARNCEKKPVKSNPTTTTETLPESILNTSLNSEDNRVPSDESFQNFTNGLGFNTSLFDTDRMPSFDMSGNSRSEMFSPFTLVNENALCNLEYTNESPEKIDALPSNDYKRGQKLKESETSAVSFSSSNQIVTRAKRRQKASEGPPNGFECECKKVFQSKELLAIHFYSEHSNKVADVHREQDENGQNFNDNNEPVSEVQDNKSYVCEICEHPFKRRGMLVNHLWRTHQTVSTRVPLERAERHYPCGSCHKMYRSAAKRAHHVAVHHPGVENTRAKEIIGGKRSYTPWKCSECPREYVTRAKMLQHQRQHHPHLVHAQQKKSNLNQHANQTNEQTNTSEEMLRSKASLQQLLNFY